MLGRLERMVFGHRRLVIAACVAVTALLGWQARSLTLNANFGDMLPRSHPYVRNALAHAGDLRGQGNALRIIVEARQGTIFSPSYVETLRRIADDTFLLPGVDRSFVRSLWAPGVRWLAVTEDGFAGGPVMPPDYDGSPTALQKLRANVEAAGEVGQLVAADFASSTIVLPLTDEDAAGKPLDYAKLWGQLERLRQAYESPAIALHVTGFAQVQGDLLAGLRTVLSFFGLSAVIAAAMVFWYTRCLRSTAVVMTCSMMAVVWDAGLLRACGLGLDPYSMLVPFLVFAIGMSHGTQKMNGIMQDIGRGTGRLEAARNTFRRLFTAGLTGLLCDAVGFAVLSLIDIPSIRALALAASIGVAALVFTNLILLPVLLSYAGVDPRAARRSMERSAADRREAPPAWRAVARLSTPGAAAAAVAVAVLAGAGGWAASRGLQVGDLEAGAPELRADSRYNVDSAYMTAHYRTSSDVLIVLAQTGEGQCGTYAALAATDELEWRLQSLPGVEGTRSLADLTREMTAGLSEGSLAWYEIIPNQAVLNSILSSASRELLNQRCDLLTLSVSLRDHRADTLAAVVATVERFNASQPAGAPDFRLAAGNAGFEAATNQAVAASSRSILLWVYAAVVVLSLITFRSARGVAVAVLPLVLTSVMAEALMTTLGIGVKVATLPVTALGVGIGVDYALYIFLVTLTNLRSGLPLQAAYLSAVLFTGRVVLLTGFTLSTAVATWVLSPIKFQADMGLLLSFMFLFNMVGALLLVPAIACFLFRRGAGAGRAAVDATHGVAR